MKRKDMKGMKAMKSMKGVTLLLSAAAAGAIGVAVVAAGRERSTPPAERVPVIVELFTSEGCSSCPPADAVLIDLIEHQPVPGAEVIGLSEHVDYWDRQGWRDPFSNHSFTQRQNAYSASTGSSEVYTPEMFVDGGAPFVGSDRSQAISFITRAAAKPKPVVSLRVAASGADVLTVTIAPNKATASAPVSLAIIEDGLSSSVTGGENAGRSLKHAAVTRRLISIGKAEKDGSFAREVPLGLDSKWKRTSLHAVVFVQPGSIGPIAAAGSIALAGAAK
jgi:hypothetical protein